MESGKPKAGFPLSHRTVLSLRRQNSYLLTPVFPGNDLRQATEKIIVAKRKKYLMSVISGHIPPRAITLSDCKLNFLCRILLQRAPLWNTGVCQSGSVINVEIAKHL
jgi:hypothetical protein